MTTRTNNEALVLNRAGKEIRLDYSSLRKATLILRAVNHPIRKNILELLDSSDEMIVTDLYVQLRVEQSVVSQHLAILRKAGILITRRKGKFIYYSIDRARIKDINKMVDDISRLN